MKFHWPWHIHTWGQWERHAQQMERFNTRTGETAGEPFMELWQERRCTTCGKWQRVQLPN